MARGWESKSVEEQQAERNQPGAKGLRLSPEQAARKRLIDALMLSRRKVQHDLEASVHPARCEMLQRALLDLDNRIAALESGANPK